MKAVRMNLANVQGKLSRAEMKQIMAGNPYEEDGDGDGEYGCLGCKEDKECAQVNKGTCTKTCPGKDHKGCSGW